MSKKRSLLTQWKNRKKKEAPPSKLVQLPKGSPAPLSLGQQRLWFLQQLHPHNPFYNYADIYKFSGALNIEALFKSFQLIAKKHAILRTTFIVEEKDPIQKIKEEAQIETQHISLTDALLETRETTAHQLAIEAARKPFDLENGPLTRITLLQLEDEKYWLILSMHHIITDKWSMRILRDELASIYTKLIHNQSPNLQTLQIQYADFSYWQNQQTIDDNALNYWKQKLSGDLPLLNLPTDKTRPTVPTYKGAYYEKRLNPIVSAQLKRLAKEANTTLFVLLLSAYKVLLYRYTNQEDLLVGTPVTNRDQTAFEELIGFFNDTVVLRSNLSSNLTFMELLEQVKKTTLEAFSNKNVPFETLVKELKPQRQMSVSPIFQTMFLFHNVPTTPSLGEGIHVEHTPFDFGVSKFDLTLYFSEDQEQLTATFEYATDLFEAATIERMQLHFETLIQRIIKNPAQAISTVSILPASERQLTISEWNNTEKLTSEAQTIHQLFEEQVEQNPQRTAVVFKDQSLNYKELNDRATALAYQLVESGLKPGTIVGLYTERSLEMAIGILGILKAGGAYLPLDPHYPLERIKFMIEDAELSMVLVQEASTGAIEFSAVQTINISDNSRTISNQIALPVISEKSTAYVIYTSGSTGKPKGVVVSHANLIHSTSTRFHYYPNTPNVFLLLSSFSFDSSIVGIFWTLCSGGTLVLPKRRIEQDLVELSDLIEKNQVTHTLLLPSLYALLLQNSALQKLKSLDTVIVAGEACPSTLCNLHFASFLQKDVRLYNEYGPTEASVWCTVHQLLPEDAQAAISIGRPIHNTQIYILDQLLQPVPIGVAGELYIGGAGITQGYLNRPELTSARFVPNPFSNKPKGRLYRTGDLASYRTDGCIDFLGRVDHQVKIRGYRIELEEIRAVLSQQEEVQEAIVLIVQKENKRPLLVAYIQGTIQVESLKAFAKKRLPDYMIPSSFIVLSEFPRLPNGKINQNALKEIQSESAIENTSYVAPNSEIEKKLATIWEEVLDIQPVGITENFFDIGGDSILSIQIIAKARQEGIILSANQLFEYQTIGELALFVKTPANQKVLDEVSPTGAFSLMPIQHWFFEHHKNAPSHWNQGILFTPNFPITASTAKAAIQYLVARYDALRLQFSQDQGIWNASIKAPDEIKAFQYYEVAKIVAIEHLSAQVQSNFDLSAPHLFQCVYIHEKETSSNTLLFIAHHLIIDHVSWSILLEDFSTIAQQLQEKQAISRPPITCTYGQWSKHLSSFTKEVDLKQEVAYWQAQVISNTLLPIDQEGSIPIEESHIENITLTLDQSSSEWLTENAHLAYHTKTEDLLITALIKTICNWANTNSIGIALERHGRETIKEVTASTAVGWFTSFFPVLFEMQSDTELGQLIKSIKEQIRAIPNNGIGYGMLRYLEHDHIDKKNLGHNAQVVFNFLGNWDKRSINKVGKIEFLTKQLRHPRSERQYILEINTYIVESKLEVIWSYSRLFYKSKTMETLVSKFEANLKEIINHCINIKDTNFTPSDFPEAGLNQTDLDNLFESLE